VVGVSIASFSREISGKGREKEEGRREGPEGGRKRRIEGRWEGGREGGPGGRKREATLRPALKYSCQRGSARTAAGVSA